MNICFNGNNQTSFWDLSVNDIATLIIAGINIILLFYIFFYEKKKDNADHNFLLSQINFNIKSEWFKTVILEPNIESLHEFYVKIFNLLSHSNLNLDDNEKLALCNKVNYSCNKIEFRFISLLGCVDQNLENQCIEIIDRLRDSLANTLMGKEEIDPEEFQTQITRSKRDFISKLYNFTPIDLK